MMTDILYELEVSESSLNEALIRIDNIELSQEEWNKLEEVKSLLAKLESKLIKLQDILSKTSACFDYYSKYIDVIKSEPINTLHTLPSDPLDSNEKMQYLKSLIGGFNTLEDIKVWREEVLINQSEALEEIVSIENISQTVEDWAGIFFIPLDYIEGLLKGLTLAQDKRIISGEISWETIMGIYLGLSKYYLSRYQCVRRK